jgi:hypothetical protein
MTGVMRAPVQFLLLTMKPCPLVDASGIFFRDAEYP